MNKGGKMSRHTLPVTFHPVFDRYVEEYQKLQVKTLSLLQQAHGQRTVQWVQRIQIATQFHEYSLSRSEKMILTESAITMLDAIMAHPDGYDIPASCFHFQPNLSSVWMEIQVPPLSRLLDVEVRGASFENFALQEDLEAMKKKRPSQHPLVEMVFNSFSGKRYLDLVAEDGKVLFAFSYQPQWQHWYIPPEHVCPYQLCEMENGVNKKPCLRCQNALNLFSLWLPIAWMSLQGAFREEDSEVVIQRVTRREQKQGNPKKKQVVIDHRQFHVVRTIDISVKPPQLSDDDGSEKTLASRGSWIERTRATDPTLINPNVCDVPQRTRLLKHPRYAKYIEKHGTNEVVVKEHQKSFPKLRKKMTRAKAKRYEEEV